jgi:hypothetical protein
MTGDDVQPDAAATLDANKCAAFAQSLATAASTCGMPLPAGAQASVETWCRKGVTRASLCGGAPAAGLDCFATPDATDWTCELGAPYPTCNGDLAAALGAYCLMASGNPVCASVACEHDVDCSGNSACNSVTKQCFQKTAYCIGLPCDYDVDCPSNEKCNSAEHACVGR